MPEAVSHSRAVWSLLPVRAIVPSRLRATQTTMSLCSSGGAIGWPVGTAQSLAVLSSLPVRAILPSWLRATARTVFPCRRTLPIGLPVAVSHSLAVPCWLPERDLAVRAQTHGPDQALVLEWSAKRLPVAVSKRRAVPSPLPIRRDLAVGAESNLVDGAAVRLLDPRKRRTSGVQPAICSNMDSAAAVLWSPSLPSAIEPCPRACESRVLLGSRE